MPPIPIIGPRTSGEDLLKTNEIEGRWNRRLSAVKVDRTLQDVDAAPLDFCTILPRGLPKDVFNKEGEYNLYRIVDLTPPPGRQDESARLPPYVPFKTASDNDNLNLLPGTTKGQADRHFVDLDNDTQETRDANTKMIKDAMLQAKQRKEMGLTGALIKHFIPGDKKPPPNKLPADTLKKPVPKPGEKKSLPKPKSSVVSKVGGKKPEPPKPKPSVSKVADKPGDSKAILKPEDSKGILKPEDSKSTVKPEDSKVPVKPVDSTAIPRPSETKAIPLDKEPEKKDSMVKPAPEGEKISPKSSLGSQTSKGQGDVPKPLASSSESEETSSDEDEDYDPFMYPGMGMGGGGMPMGMMPMGGMPYGMSPYGGMPFGGMQMPFGGMPYGGMPYGGYPPQGYPYQQPPPPCQPLPCQKKTKKQTEKAKAARKKTQGMNFDFLPHDNCCTEVTLTIEPDEPDPLECAVENGIMPIVCCYMPPAMTLDPTSPYGVSSEQVYGAVPYSYGGGEMASSYVTDLGSSNE